MQIDITLHLNQLFYWWPILITEGMLDPKIVPDGPNRLLYYVFCICWLTIDIHQIEEEEKQVSFMIGYDGPLWSLMFWYAQR